MNNKSKQYIFIGAILVVLSILLAYFLFFGQRSKVTVNIPLPNSQVIINREQMIVPEEGELSVSKNLKNGENEIIVTKEGYFPWTKNLNLNKDIVLNPFLISQSPSGQIITQSDPEYFSIKEKIGLKNIPDQNNPLSSKDKKVLVWVGEDNQIFWQSENSNGVVVKPQSKVRNISFYKERNDVLIFGTEEGIYAIDIKESNGLRNFMPVYIGTNPDYIPGQDTNYIYVSDTNSLMIVMI